MKPFTRDENTNPKERSLADHGWLGPVEKYSLDISEGHIYVWGSEKNPGECHEEKGESHSQKFRPSRCPRFSHDVLGISAIQTEEKQWKKQQSMDEAPHHESPIGPMPKPRDQEDDEGVSNGLPFPNTGPPKWDVQVIAEPRGQGDVPSPPKFSDVT